MKISRYLALAVLLCASAASHAALLKYEMTFRGENAQTHLSGSGYFITDTANNSLVQAYFTSPYFSASFVGDRPFYFEDYYYYGYTVYAADMHDPLSGISFRPFFWLEGNEGHVDFASNLDKQMNGEFWSGLFVSPELLPLNPESGYLAVDYQIQAPYIVPEPATLSLFSLGLAVIGLRKRLRYSNSI